jgi:hypothetical protein
MQHTHEWGAKLNFYFRALRLQDDKAFSYGNPNLIGQSQHQSGVAEPQAHNGRN